jgi:putative addiction module component (TIGR02574 family)
MTPLTTEQLTELDRRLDDAEAGRGSTVQWSVVKARLRKRLQQ